MRILLLAQCQLNDTRSKRASLNDWRLHLMQTKIRKPLIVIIAMCHDHRLIEVIININHHRAVDAEYLITNAPAFALPCSLCSPQLLECQCVRQYTYRQDVYDKVQSQAKLLALLTGAA